MDSKIFNKYKKDVLTKMDKSPKGFIDEKIRDLCVVINSRDDMFTLSSCSGRIVLLEKNEEGNKKGSNWLFVSHKIVNEFDLLFEIINNYNGKNKIEFRQESVILHIVVKDFETASFLMNLAKESGFNRVGIIGFKKKITLELICDIELIIPVFDKEVLITKEFLEYIIDLANKNLEKSWERIKKLEQKLSKNDPCRI